MRLPTADGELLLLHNPRCSKSRATLAALEETLAASDGSGPVLEVREYLKDPLSREELEAVSARLGLPPSAFVRRKESAFAEAGCGAESSEAEILDAMAASPILMERPILVRGERAAIGRPPEKVLELL